MKLRHNVVKETFHLFYLCVVGGCVYFHAFGYAHGTDGLNKICVASKLFRADRKKKETPWS